ncbi:hypothetical protein PR202_gb23329 [Eleusine coracana subsp. coracana]|uniref:FAR1 domain-containing protein n=1 Tax=Eleusine coracana subsp. coracana TaxID=191504 RepID=A0AAV5FJ51_ELECO|nr:hypothetical protein PR202_gb23329 [Eleusine coracana subsp. coracana]
MDAAESSHVISHGQSGRRRGPSGIDDPSTNITTQESNSDMSISTDDEGIEQLKEASIELSEENVDAQSNDLLTEEPDLGMTFDSEDAVWLYYTNYAKSKGFGVTRRSSRTEDDGELKYLTLSCSRHSKSQSKSKNMLKPNALSGIECKAKVNVTRQPDVQQL